MAEAPVSGPSPAVSRSSVVLAFAVVYVVWGSTYLAIRYALETLPPFLMASARFLAAGSILYAWARLAGAERPTARHWRSAAVIGALLFLCGNGGVVWAEQWVPSGLAALLVATVPLWTVVFEALGAGPGGRRPEPQVLAGVVLGLVGVGLLARPEGGAEGAPDRYLAGALVLIAGSIAWSLGSLYAVRAPLPPSPRLGTAMQMLTGGVFLGGLATVHGDWQAFDPAAVSARSLLATLYLIVFGAILAFSAYVYALRHTSPSVTSTYAYVNPVVAVFLGWALAGEPVTGRTLLAAAIIIGGVMVITLGRAARLRGERRAARRSAAGE